MPLACQPLSYPPDDLLPFKFTSVTACFPFTQKKAVVPVPFRFLHSRFFILSFYLPISSS